MTSAAPEPADEPSDPELAAAIDAHNEFEQNAEAVAFNALMVATFYRTLVDRSLDGGHTMSSTTPDPLYVGQCECGEKIYRKTLAGVPPKSCDACRQFKGRAAYDGPIAQVRAVMADVQSRRRDVAGGVNDELPVQVAGAALAGLTGMTQEFAESIVGTIDVLLGHGETPNDVRRRLNPNPAGFGKVAAGSAWPGFIDEDDEDDEILGLL